MHDLTLVHFSDLHFGSGGPGMSPSTAFRRAVEACVPHFDGAPRVLAITGDITYRGTTNGFVEARRALGLAADLFPPQCVVMCPGNHDVVEGSFDSFNQFAFQVTNDPNQRWSRPSPVALVERAGYKFVLVNSYYQGDPSRGSIPLDDLKRALAEHPRDRTVVLVHDSPIASSYGGQSLIDGYDFLHAVSRADAAAALHGHVHSDQALLVGKRPTLVGGAGSLAFRPDPNMNNHFALYKFFAGRVVRGLSFKYFVNADAFVATPMEGIGL